MIPIKKFLSTLAIALSSISASAQITDSFESNSMGWSEFYSSDAIAVIEGGKMHLEGKSKPTQSECYVPLDFTKPFTVECQAFVKSLTGKKNFGIILDYEDDYNYLLLLIEDETVHLMRTVANRTVASKVGPLKLKSSKKTSVDFKVEYNLQKLTYYINGMKVMEYQRRLLPGETLIGTQGIGFYADKNTIVDFDNLEITQ